MSHCWLWFHKWSSWAAIVEGERTAASWFGLVTRRVRVDWVSRECQRCGAIQGYWTEHEVAR